MLSKKSKTKRGRAGPQALQGPGRPDALILVNGTDIDVRKVLQEGWQDTHNAQHVVGDVPLERAWERLKSRQLHSFLSEINAKGSLTLTKTEVLQGVEQVKCSTCQSALREAATRAFEETKPQHICHSVKATCPTAAAGGAKGPTGEPALHFGNSISPNALAQIKQFVVTSGEAGSVQEKEETKATHAHMNGGDQGGDKEDATAGLLCGGSAANGSVMVVNEFCLQDMLLNLKTLQSNMLELSVALQSQMAQDGKSGVATQTLDWAPNRAFTQIFPQMENSFKHWMHQMANLILRLSKIEALSVVLDSDDRKLIKEMMTELWNRFEVAMENILEATAKGRQEQLKDLPASAHPIFFTLGAMSSKARVVAQKTLQRKRKHMEDLQTFVSRQLEEGTPTRLLVEQLWALPEQLEFFSGSEWAALDHQESEALSVRMHICTEGAMISSRQEVVQSESAVESHLKRVLTDWEALLDRHYEHLRTVLKEDLSHERFPQTVEMATDIEVQFKEFHDEWENQLAAYQFQARLSQDKLSGLNLEAHRRKLLLKDKAEKGKANKSGSTPTVVYLNGDIVTDGDDDESQRQLAAAIHQAQQQQIEQCLRFRIFAAKNYLVRQRLLREVTATIKWLLARKPELTQRLCGGEAEASGKLRLLLGRMMLEKLERLCGEWQAEVVERELVADEARADEKRRKARARIQQSQNQHAQQKPRKSQTGKPEEVSGQEGQAEELMVEPSFVPVNGVAERMAPEAVVPSVAVEGKPEAVVLDADGFNILDYDPAAEVDEDQGWTTVAPKEKERGKGSKRRGGKGVDGASLSKGSWKLERTSSRGGKDRDQGEKPPKTMAAHATEAAAAPPAPPTEPGSASVSVSEGDESPARVREQLPLPPSVEEENPGVSASGEHQVVLEMSEEQWPQLPAAEDSMRQQPVVEPVYVPDAATPPPPPPRPDVIEESFEAQPQSSPTPPTTTPPRQPQTEEPESSSAVETEVPLSAEAAGEAWMEQEPQTQSSYPHEAQPPPQDEGPVVEEYEEDSDSDVEIMFGDLGPEPSADAAEEGEEAMGEREGEFELEVAGVEEQQPMASMSMAPEHMEPASMPQTQGPEGPHAPAPATGERPPQAVDAAQQQMYMAPPPPYYYQPNTGAGPPSFDGGMHMGLPPHLLPTGPDGAPLHHGHMGPPHGYTPHYPAMYGHALQHGQHYPMEMQQMQAYHQHQPGPHQPHARPPQQHFYPTQTAPRPHMPANAGGRGQSRGGFRGPAGGYEQQHQQHQQHHHGMDQGMMKAGAGQTGGGYGMPQYYGSPHHYQHQHQHHQQQHQMPNAGANPYVGYGKKGSPEMSPYQPVPQRGMGPHAHTHRGTTHHTPSPPHRSRNYSQGGGRGAGRPNQQQQHARTWRSVPPEAERAGEPEDGEKEDRTDAVNPGEVPSSSRSPESEDAEPELSASESLDGKAIAPDEPPRTPLRVEENRARVPLPIRHPSREGVEGAHTHASVPPPVEVTSSSSAAAPTRGRKKNKSPTPTSSSSSSQGSTHTRSRETSSVSPERVDSNSMGGSNGASAQAAGKEPLPAGLTNRTGQNHCFLNVVVQSLWSLRAFRDRVCRASTVGDGDVGGWGEGGGSVSLSSAGRVEMQLKDVFEGLSSLEGGEGSTESARSVSVDGLRQVLSELAGKAKFCAGHMDDAVEAFEEILGFLIEGGGEGRRAVEDSFCLHMREMMMCPGCGHTSPNPPREYDTNIFYVPVRSLMEVAARMGVGMGGVDRVGFDRLLQGAGSGDLYSCSTPGCMLARRGEKRAGHRYLVHQPPRVFCLGLVWDSLKGDSREIQKLMGLIEPHVKLDSLLLQTAEESVGRSVNGGGNRVSTGGGVSGGRGGVAAGAALRGFFAFHPQKHHYVAFLYHHASGRWICLDDSEVKVLGPSHLDALKHCVECQYQPSLLFYEIQAPSAPSMATPTSSSSSTPSPSAQLKAVTLESGDGRVRMSGVGHA